MVSRDAEHDIATKQCGAEWQGLSEQEAQRLLRETGPNTLPTYKPATLLRIILESLREPMVLLLVGTGLVYLFVGDIREAIAIIMSILVVIGISVTQRRKTERTLDALRDLTSPRALVIRKEGMRRIAARDLVPGDLFVINEGDRVPADATLLDSVLLGVDESLLTGESFPVEKAAPVDSVQPRSDQTVYSATLVVRGHGIARVFATGTRTQIGSIGHALSETESESTKLERETNHLVRIFGTASLIVCVVVAAMHGLLRGDWTKGAISALALAISLVPEEFPLVLTIFMALGAWRISQKKVLTRRFPVIEMLGSATVICVDKTGTLTENRMAVREVQTLLGTGTNHEEVLRTAALASAQITADPVDKAMTIAAGPVLAPGILLQEYPLSADCMLVAKAYQNNGTVFIAAKGAPEEILRLSISTPQVQEQFRSLLKRMTGSGMRVLAVGRQVLATSPLPSTKSALRLEIMGLIGMADPIRATVPSAIAELASAGIRVLMITGDYAGTATSIARQAGLPNATVSVSGDELETMDKAALRRAVRTCNVFARVRPDQKLRLIQALKANGEVVAMTGDGVNDAPALKAAHIGIAMGARGSDVAREASALVLADDDFPAIADAVRLGRRIYDNLTKAARYVFAVHVPIAGLAILPVALNWPILLMPLHIVFFELIVDPACTVAFEAEPDEPGLMRRRPRPESANLFGASTVAIGLLQGFGLFACVLAAFAFAKSWGHAPEDARAIAFSSLVAGNLMLIWTNRSATKTVLETARVRNIAAVLVTLGTIGALLIVLYVPAIRAVFQFSVLHPKDLLAAVALGFLTIAWFEVLKLVHRRARRT